MNHRSYLLELDSLEDFRAKEFPEHGIVIFHANSDHAERCRRLWTEVGRGFWSDRQDWNPGQWTQHVGQDCVSFWIATRGAEDIGFFELRMNGREVKIEGFGLLPVWRGKDMGGGLLSVATRQAFAEGARRIWLHTATDDHPNALSNYLKRGYRVYHEEALADPMPNRSVHRTRAAGRPPPRPESSSNTE